MDGDERDIQIAHAVRLLKSGVPVAIPTETVYGLAAPIDSEDAVRAVFQLKDRPFFDPLIVHISDMAQLKGVAEPISPAERVLMNAFWPGPCTFILRKRAGVLPLITAGLDTVAVRMPSHRVAREIIRLVGSPLAAPSANKFGRTSPSEANHVRSDWPGGEVYVVDSGRAEHGLESTVLRVASDEGSRAVVELLRPGVVLAADVRSALGAAGITADIRRVESSASPGHTPQHYMPRVPLVVVPAEWLPLSAANARRIFEAIGAEPQPFVILELASDPRIAARELYAKLHELSTSGAGVIVFGTGPGRETELWEAIQDRLRRAATAWLS